MRWKRIGENHAVRGWARGAVGGRCQHAEVAQPVHKVKGQAGAAVSGATWLEQSRWSTASRPGRGSEVCGGGVLRI